MGLLTMAASRHGSSFLHPAGLLALAGLALAAPWATRAQEQPIAIVVDRDNTASDISAEELRSFYLGKRHEWADGTRAVPVDLEAGAPRRGFLTAVLRMDEAAYDRYWVDQKVRGAGTGPRRVASASLVVRLVARVRGAVGFVPLSRVDGSVKILTVGGVAPGEPGYPLIGDVEGAMLGQAVARTGAEAEPGPAGSG